MVLDLSITLEIHRRRVGANTRMFSSPEIKLVGMFEN